MTPKILITVDGGIVTKLAANLPDCHIVVVDFDLKGDSEWPVMVIPKQQDEQFRDGMACLLFNGDTEHEVIVADELKKLNF